MEIQELWLDRFKKMRESLSSINNWLIILNLTVLFTFLQQYFEIKKQQNDLVQTQAVLDYPWAKLQLFYEATNGNLEQYTENHATRWLQLCLATSLQAMALNENLGAKKDNPTLTATIKQISFACRSLSYYNADLRHVVASQKNQRRFNELDKETLLSLANIFQFDSKAKIDSFKVGTKKAVETAKLILAIDQQLLKAGKPINQKPKMISVLQYADSIDDFTTISTEMTLLDYRSFGDLGTNDKDINKIKSFLKANPFNNLTYYANKKNACIEKIRDLKSGKFFALPLVGVEISLLQFVIISWLINLCVILYVRNVWTNLNNYWKEYKKNSGNNLVTIEETKALWYRVSVATGNKTLFTIFHSVFLSFITVTGLVFGLILFKYSGLELLSLLCATVIIVIISIFCAFRFYNIYQSA